MNPNFQQYFQNSQRRTGSGCCLSRLFSCLFLIILIVVCVIAYNHYKHSPIASVVTQGFNASVAAAKDESVARGEMHVIGQAIVQYRSEHGSYPPSLKSLVPKYLPKLSALHSQIDPNTNPDHVSFTYIRPSADAPMTTMVLSITNSYAIPATQGKVTITTSMSLDQSIHQSPYTSSQ